MLKNIQKGDLSYFCGQGISVPHCFTTRLGGVSENHLSSMNIGIHRGDSRENVLKNYKILGDALGFSPEQLVLTTQTHSDIVRVVDSREQGAGLFGPELPPCDALVTCTPGVGLVAFTADCTPILLWDPVTGAVGAVHAGWRGTASQIAGKAVRTMREAFGTRPQDIRAVIGPNIGRCCFETDRDVPDAMREALGDGVRAYIRQQDDKFYLDLKAINTLILNRAGVTRVEKSELCTVCRPDLFWSYRRDGSQRGSQGALILCEGANQ